MPFKEVLIVIVEIDKPSLNKMDESLSKRFAKISKKFGKGLVAALTGGGIAGVALGFIDKILNPLKETQEAIDKALQRGNDVVTNAKQFGTTAGKLFHIQQLAKAGGISPEEIDVLLEKFQTAQAAAKADPSKATSVRQYANDKDSGAAFFEWIQALQKLPKEQQVLAQTEVFGEKQILHMANFMQTDFVKQDKALGARPSEQYTPGLQKLSDLKDLREAQSAKVEMEDMLTKSKTINQDMIKSMGEEEQKKVDLENRQIESYQSLATIAALSTDAVDIAKKAYLTLTDMAVSIGKIVNSRFIRGLLGSKDQ